MVVTYFLSYNFTRAIPFYKYFGVFFIGMVELGSVLRHENHLKEFQNLYFNFCHTAV